MILRNRYFKIKMNNKGVYIYTECINCPEIGLPAYKSFQKI